jgi:hypothetical protein
VIFNSPAVSFGKSLLIESSFTFLGETLDTIELFLADTREPVLIWMLVAGLLIESEAIQGESDN